MESQWIKALESSVKSKIGTSKIFKDALNETLHYLYKKDILEKTSYCNSGKIDLLRVCIQNGRLSRNQTVLLRIVRLQL